MKQLMYIFLFLGFFNQIFAQNYYFPPTTGTAWDTVSPASLGWCTNKIDTLTRFLQAGNTKGFIVLKNGKIAIERYFGTFTRDSNWYWASAGKTLTGFTVGIAQQEGFLKISDTTSKYLGRGWTRLTRAQEDKITVRHQLTMTTGLNDLGADPDCTLPSCLTYQADAGTRWAYHNAPYTLLDSVVESATGQKLNTYIQQKIRSKIGMNGLFVKLGYNNVHFSTVRSFARFGLLLLNKGSWATTPILTDTAFFRQMTNTSQNLNLSYGYLTWLNGKASFMAPGSQRVISSALTPAAPADMYSGLGKNGQIVQIVPSQGLVVVRMGDAPDGTAVPIIYVNQMWELLSQVICRTTPTENIADTEGVFLSPNPVFDQLQLQFSENLTPQYLAVFDLNGRQILKQNADFQRVNVTNLAAGIYFLQVVLPNQKTVTRKFVKLQ
jgi:CubicO group peptidase (beta-lactamase class C family)